MNTQKNTYLIFGRGLNLGRLKIGSLLIDPANPQERAPYIHNSTEEDLSKWTDDPQKDTPCSLHFKASHGWLASLNLLSLLNADASRDSDVALEIRGESGRRFQLVEPEMYLNEVVLKNATAQEWMLSHLAVSRSKYYLGRAQGRCPGIWMVTGLQYVENGNVKLSQGVVGSTGAGFTLITPKPISGVTTTSSGIGTASLKANAHQKSVAGTAYGHADERIWAAQYMKLMPRWKEEVVSEDILNSTSLKWVKLAVLIDLRAKGVRNDEDEDEDQQETRDAYAVVDSAELKHYSSAEDMQKEMMEDTSLVDWELVSQYLEQEEALRKDAEDV